MTRDLRIMHVDLDAFFASVEQRDEPSLRGKPVAVGATSGRGVVAAASYEARRFGVRSAMSMAEARRRCPGLIVCPPRFDAYAQASEAVHEVFVSVTPLVEPIALDEAFLDIHGAVRDDAEVPVLAERVRRDIRDAVALTASVGVGTTKLVAKLASDDAKPDGVRIVVPTEERAYLDPLPVQRLWGVGPATLDALHRLGIETVGQLAHLPVDALTGALGLHHGAHLAALARNDDPRPVEPEREAKSIGKETTLAADIADRAEAERIVRGLAAQVAERLRRAGQSARTVQLKVRYADFTTITRARTFAHGTDVTGTIEATARQLLDEVSVQDGVRLLGVSVALLAPTAVQGELLFSGVADPAHDAVIDAVRARFGAAALKRASEIGD